MAVTRHQGNGAANTFPIQYTPSMDSTATVGGAPTAVQSQTPASVTFATAPLVDEEVLITHTAIGFPITYEELGYEGVTWDINLTGDAVRAAYSNPAAFGTTGSVTGWLLPGLAGARLSADSMTGPRLVRVQDGSYEWAPHNLLTYSEAFDNAAWTKDGATVSADAVAGPFSGTLADTLVEDASNGSHRVFRAVTLGADNDTAWSFWVKRASGTRNIFAITQVSGALVYIRVNLGTGAVIQTGVNTGGSDLTVSVAAAQNGYWRVSLGGRINTANPFIQIYIANTDTADGAPPPLYQGDNASGIHLYGGQLNRGLVPTAYVPTTTAARYAPPVEHDGTAWGVRGEPAGTNLALWSADMSNAAWDVVLTAATKVGAATAVGAVPMYRVNVGTHGGTAGAFGTASAVFQTGITLAGATTYTVSALVRAVSGTSVFRIGTTDTASTGIGSDNLTATTTAQVFTFTGTTAVGGSFTGNVSIRAGSAGGVVGDIEVGGFQLEAGAIATSPIPTFGAAVTRTIDNIRLPDEMGDEGTVVLEWVPIVAGDASSPVIIGQSASINHGPFTDGSQALSHWNGSAVLTAAGTITAGARNVMALGWSAGGRSINLNGGAVAADAGAIGTTDTIRIGATGAGNQPSPLRARTLRLSRRRLSDAQLRALTL
jgi:hypothetical protein